MRKLYSNIIVTHFNPVFGTTEKEFIDASPMNYMEDFDLPMLIVSEFYAYNFTMIFEEALHKAEYKKCKF